MNPAFSVLFLTTLIGAGQGLLIALVLGQILSPDEGPAFFVLGSLLALVLLGLGLLASFFHLANPQRAWRAATRWRTSWLSREVILLPAVCGCALLYGGAHLLGLINLSLVLGVLAVVASVALFVCTGMIYACVRFIRNWASSWTVINYLLMGLASGFTLAAAYAAVMGSGLRPLLVVCALILTLAAMAAKLYHLRLNAGGRDRSSLKTAIGVRHPQVNQISQGFMGQSFNTLEFAAPGGAETTKGLTLFFTLAAFAVPAGLLAVSLGGQGAVLLVFAVLCQYVGLLAERWVFFASGNHVQSLYYQAKA